MQGDQLLGGGGWIETLESRKKVMVHSWRVNITGEELALARLLSQSGLEAWSRDGPTEPDYMSQLPADLQLSLPATSG